MNTEEESYFPRVAREDPNGRGYLIKSRFEHMNGSNMHAVQL